MKRQLLFAALCLLLTATVGAQDICEPAPPGALDALAVACADAPTNTLCTADETVTLGDGLPDAMPPAQLTLDDARVLYWGQLALSTLEQRESAVTERPASNAAGFNVNLRGGPGTSYEVVGILGFDETETADARTADSLWVRLQTDEGAAWVSASLIRLDEGGLEDLRVIAADAPATAGQPALRLTLGDGCDNPRGAALIWSLEADSAALTLNELALRLDDNALSYVALNAEAAELYALSGALTATVDAQTAELTAAQGLRVRTDAEPSTVTFDSADALRTFPPAVLDAHLTACYALPSGEDYALYEQPNADATAVRTRDALRLTGISHQDEQPWYVAAQPDGQTGYVRSDSATLTGTCDLPVTNAAPTTTAPGAVSLPPADTMMVYLEAMVNGNAGRMQQVSCAAWDFQASIQAQSFAAANAQLEAPACETVSQSDGQAIVTCSGNIVTEYDGEFRDFPLTRYRFVQEGGAWRMCGEG